MARFILSLRKTGALFSTRTRSFLIYPDPRGDPRAALCNTHIWSIVDFNFVRRSVLVASLGDVARNF